MARSCFSEAPHFHCKYDTSFYFLRAVGLLNVSLDGVDCDSWKHKPSMCVSILILFIRENPNLSFDCSMNISVKKIFVSLVYINIINFLYMNWIYNIYNYKNKYIH